jgi:hypothetical protein
VVWYGVVLVMLATGRCRSARSQASIIPDSQPRAAKSQQAYGEEAMWTVFVTIVYTVRQHVINIDK